MIALLWTALGQGALIMALSLPSYADEQEAEIVSKSEVAYPVAAGRLIYIDTETGRIVSGAPPSASALLLSPEDQGQLSHSHVNLYSVPHENNTGEMLDLQGRFRHFAVATTEGEGARHCVGNQVVHEHPTEASADSGSEP
jgi:hypothetical protein